jgi:hypothetical protein
MSFRGMLSGLRNRARAGFAPPELSSSAQLSNAAVAVQDRRRSPRRYGDPVEVRLSSYEATDLPCGPTGWVRDRCLNGLAFTVDKPLEIGCWVRARPTFVSEDAAWVGLLVRHCHQQGNRWVIGCEFVETPPREVMLLFR